MLRAVALPARASTLVNLASATKTLVGLERQAFNLDAPEANDNVVNVINADPMTEEEWAAKYCKSDQ